MAQSPNAIRFAVGCLTRRTSYFDNANGEGIEIVEFDKEALSFRRVSVTSGIDNPAYLAFNPVTNMIYANSEVEGWNEGTVSAYRYDVATGKLTYMNKQPTLGSIAAHNILDAAGTNLFVTNYSHENDIELPRKATAMFALNADGSIAPCRASVTHHGSGPDPVRQRVAHPHGAVPHPDGKLVSVADLGLDSVFHYAFDETTGDMIEAPASITRLAPGCGPRHLLMSADGATIYVINELNSTVSVLRKSGAGTEWAEVQVVSTLPETSRGRTCARRSRCRRTVRTFTRPIAAMTAWRAFPSMPERAHSLRRLSSRRVDGHLGHSRSRTTETMSSSRTRTAMSSCRSDAVGVTGAWSLWDRSMQSARQCV